MRIGILTTSRADYGIYKPLLYALKSTGLDITLFVGGMHLNQIFGDTYKEIIKDGFNVHLAESSLAEGDSPIDISFSIRNTIDVFSRIWNDNKHEINLLFTLGDRFEMFAAASAAVPFNIKIAHIHGGEISKGAIDNKFRYALSAFADYHFVSSGEHFDNLKSTYFDQVFNVGSLGVEAAINANLLAKEEFFKRYEIQVDEGFALVTFHPETVDLRNDEFSMEWIKSLKEIPIKILCTLPNADTQSKIIRSRLLSFEKEYPKKIKCFENLGQTGYYSAMKYASIMIGNTSSGLIESTAFGTKVINVGNRQSGRQCGLNVISVSNVSEEIVNAYSKLMDRTIENDYPFGTGDSSSKIIKIIRERIANEI